MKNRLLATTMLLMLLASFLPIMLSEANGSSSLGGTWYLDEGTGTTAYDSSGNANNGVTYGSSWTNGKIGKALDFDGVNDYVEVPDSNSLDITGKITMEAWIYPHTMTNLQIIVSKYNHSGSNGAYYLGLGGYGYMNKILFALSPNGVNFYYMLSNNNITANTWTHVAGTSNGTHMILYLNGVKDSVRTYAPGIVKATTKPLRIGCYLPELGYPRFFDGLIDEVRVWPGTIWTVDDDKVQCPTADFTSIQAAINKSSADDTIIVHDGTYNEALYINRSLTVKAASMPIITGGQLRATNYGNRQATIFVENAGYVVLQGFDVEGQGLGVPSGTKSYAILYENSDGMVKDCTVSPNTINDMYCAALAAWDNSDVTIKCCMIQNFGRIGIYSNNATLAIQSNTIIGQVYSLDNKVNYGIEIEDYTGPSIATITDNEIYDCDNTHPSPLWSSCAIIVDIWRGFYDLLPSKVTIENNDIHNNFEAMEIVSNTFSYAHYNDIYDNRYGVWVDADLYNNYAMFDARFNWWGDASGPNQATTNPSGLGNDAGDYVDYSPWLGFVVGTVSMTWHVNPTGTIQEAIDEAVSGDTIIVHEGTYNEALYINKNLTMKGGSLPIIQGSGSFTTNYGAREAVIFVENADVTLENLDIEGQGLGPGKNYAVIYEESVGTIRGCMISPNTVGDMVGNAIGIWDGSDVNVRECTVKSYGRIGVFFYDGCSGGVYNSIVEGQVYSDEGFVNYGIEVESWNDPCNVEIMGNDIYYCDNTHPSPLWSSAGVVIDGWVAYYDLPSSTVIMSCNDIYDNYFGIEVVANPNSYAHYNNIYNNRKYGAIEDPNSFATDVNFDARYNWWGDATGPYHATLNLGGLGNDVSDYVVFQPWLYVEKVPPLIHDVAIVKVLPSTVRVVPGQTVQIDVTAKNDGTTYENFTVTLYYDGNIIGIQSINNLIPGTEKVLMFLWNTAGTTPGTSYTLTAVASTVPGETDTADNTKTADKKVRIGEPAILKAPTYKATSLNQIVSINITVNDLKPYWRAISVEFRLTYNSTLLQFINVTEGPFLKNYANQQPGSYGTFFIYFNESVPHWGPSVIIGIIILPNGTGYWNPPFPEGNGTIATVNFRAVRQDRGLEKLPLTCDLVLTETKILDDDGETIPYNVQNGAYRMYPTHAGDFNYDGRVDMDDIYRCARAFGEMPGRPRWDPVVDVTGDNRIDMADLYIVAKGFGWHQEDP